MRRKSHTIIAKVRIWKDKGHSFFRGIFKEKLQKKNYHRNRIRLQLPLFQSRVSKKTLVLVSGVGILLCGISIIFLLFGPVFLVSKIEVIRKDNISNIDIVYRAVDGLRSESLLWLDKSKISESITKYQGNITDIEISKVLPDTLKIVVGSARGLFLTAYKGTSYLVTSNGVFVPYELEEGVPFLEVHTDAEYDLSIVAYKQILHPEYVQAANYLIQKLQDNLLTISIERLDYYVEERELHVSLKDGPILLFDVFGSLDDQIKKLLIYDKEQTPIMRAGLVYMDLRVPGKIFSCTTEQEYQCYANLKRIYTKD